MPPRKRQKRVRNEIVEIHECENGEEDAIFIPNSNDSGSSDSESDSESDSKSDSDTEAETAKTNNTIPNISYQKILNNYERLRMGCWRKNIP